jgi:hypothetical protein
MPVAASASVTVWATVKAVTCHRSGPRLRGEEEQAQHEEDMVEAERHDMLEPRPDVAQEHRARALGQNLGTRQRWGQFTTIQKPFVGVLPTADLARDEGAPTGRDTDLHARRPGR